MSDAALRRRVARDVAALERAFGRPGLGRRRLRPLEELVLTILSQSTNDRNRDRAWRALRRRFPDWEAILDADPAAVEDVIRVGGLARTKSRVIQAVLRRVRDEFGTLSLDHLRDVEVEAARAYLRGLKGVGEKTACCVLLFSCGLPAFPVDTHVLRVARRLGWAKPGATAARVHAALAGLVPQDDYLPAHLNLIALGRRICRPREPDCPACPLAAGCAWKRGRPRPILALRRGLSAPGDPPHAGRVQRRAGARRGRGARPGAHRGAQGP